MWSSMRCSVRRCALKTHDSGPLLLQTPRKRGVRAAVKNHGPGHQQSQASHNAQMVKTKMEDKAFFRKLRVGRTNVTETLCTATREPVKPMREASIRLRRALQ